MPAAPAITSLLGTMQVKTMPPSVAPATGDDFGQVLRSARKAVSNQTLPPARINGVQRASQLKESNPKAPVKAAPANDETSRTSSVASDKIASHVTINTAQRSPGLKGSEPEAPVRSAASVKDDATRVGETAKPARREKNGDHDEAPQATADLKAQPVGDTTSPAPIATVAIPFDVGGNGSRWMTAPRAAPEATAQPSYPVREVNSAVAPPTGLDLTAQPTDTGGEVDQAAVLPPRPDVNAQKTSPPSIDSQATASGGAPDVTTTAADRIPGDLAAVPQAPADATVRAGYIGTGDNHLAANKTATADTIRQADPGGNNNRTAEPPTGVPNSTTQVSSDFSSAGGKIAGVVAEAGGVASGIPLTPVSLSANQNQGAAPTQMSSAPDAAPTTPGALAQQPADPTGAISQAVAGQPPTPPTTPLQAESPATVEAIAQVSMEGRNLANPEAALPPASQGPARRGQLKPTAGDSGTSMQPATAASADPVVRQAGLAQSQMELATPPGAPTGAPAAAQAPDQDRSLVLATGHKMTSHSNDADAGPAQSAATSVVSPELPAPLIIADRVPSTAPTAEAASAHAATPASPAEQMAPALLSLAKTIEGSHEMTVRLHPADLGMVQVAIARAASGTTQITITAEHSSTLLAVQQDQQRLHRMLDDAGIPAVGRTVTLNVAPPVPATHSIGSSSGPTSSGGHSGSPQGSAGRMDADAEGSSTGGRGSYPTRERNTYSSNRRSSTAPAKSNTDAARVANSYRIGLDITA